MAEWTSDPLVPVIVSVELAIGVVEFVVIVRVELLEPVMETGLKDADVLLGRPVALKLTVPLNPFNAATFTV